MYHAPRKTALPDRSATNRPAMYGRRLCRVFSNVRKSLGKTWSQSVPPVSTLNVWPWRTPLIASTTRTLIRLVTFQEATNGVSGSTISTRATICSDATSAGRTFNKVAVSNVPPRQASETSAAKSIAITNAVVPNSRMAGRVSPRSAVNDIRQLIAHFGDNSRGGEAAL